MPPIPTIVRGLTTLTVPSDIVEMVINVRDAGADLQKLRRDHHEKDIRDKLSAADPSINYANALDKRHKGTGLWFIGGQAFADWLERSSSFLWLHGIPGCGKTILSSTIIEHMKSVTAPDRVLLYFYFDFTDTNKQTFESMLRSLIYQLYKRQPETRGPVDQLWESVKQGNQQLSKSSLSDVLTAMLSNVNNVSIVLDALDESTTKSDLLTWLRHVLGTDSCRVLVTARREEDIESTLQRWMRPEDRVGIRQNDINDDIRAYVGHTVRNSEELVRWHKLPSVQDEIETELVNRADGM
jgi:hypothetical protein